MASEILCVKERSSFHDMLGKGGLIPAMATTANMTEAASQGSGARGALPQQQGAASMEVGQEVPSDTDTISSHHTEDGDFDMQSEGSEPGSKAFP